MEDALEPRPNARSRLRRAAASGAFLLRRAAAFAAFLCLTATPAGAASTPSVVAADASHFPSVLVTVRLPGTADLGIDDVSLSENGQQVPDVIVKSLAVSNGEYQSVILVIDNTKDVSASELKEILDAAQTFITTVPDTVPFGVVTMASKPQVLQKAEFHDQPQAKRALATIRPTSSDAALGPALSAAAGAETPKGQHNILLFSGASAASQPVSGSVTKAVDRTSAAVSAIVLGSAPGKDLAALVSHTSGSAATASAGTLSDTTTTLAHEIGDQYLLSYQSYAAPGSQLNIAIDVKGQHLEATAEVPTSASPNPSPTPNPALFSGTRGYILIIVIIVALLVLTSIPGRVRDRRRRRAGGGGGGGRRGGRRTRRRERQGR
jgi:hypothetical protein